MSTCKGKNSTLTLSDCWRNSMRKHEGEYSWKKDQSYEGECLRDSMHGQGTYRWEEEGVFEGNFYSNYKEGYAIVSFRDNCYFEGLFVRNKAFGPGIFTYANGRQDAGFWMGRKLVRLSRAVDYIIPRLAPTSVAKIKLLQFRRLIPLNDSERAHESRSWNAALKTVSEVESEGPHRSSNPQRNSAHEILERYNQPIVPSSSSYSTLIYDPRSLFFDSRLFEKTYFVNMSALSGRFESRSLVVSEEEKDEEEAEEMEETRSVVAGHCLCAQDVFEMQYVPRDEVDVCEMESSLDISRETGILYNLTKYGSLEKPEKDEEWKEDAGGEEDEGEEEEEEATEWSKVPKIVSWNRSELCTEMLKQIFRYRAFEDKLNFNLAKLMLGARTAFRRTGVREKECLHFLKMCSLGPPHAVKDLLCNYDISEELMDARGNNSLMFAAATDQVEIIDILLDYGVDVNAFNDEGLTPLNLCLLRRLAYANNISNWEAAFLPKEIDQSLVPEGYEQSEAWDGYESIPSLDRVFGDGMSIDDSKPLVFDARLLAPIVSPSQTKDHSEKSTARALHFIEESKDSSSMSQITVLNILRSARSLLNSSIEDLNQALLSNRSQVFSTHSRPLATNQPTPKVDLKMVPKTNKRDEFERSVTQTTSDKYLFEFTFEKSPSPVALGSKKKEGSAKAQSAKGKTQKDDPAVVEIEEEPSPDLALIEKVETIDRTIEKLVKRGADPNISEVPKPSIHLGVYTKDVPTVRLLLMYGANPGTQLYPNEGLLTPLHVLVLLKPAVEFVYICELLLSFGANPDEETHPEFFMTEEEKSFLDSQQGRTPLQLLCMRPDVEYGDPDDNLIKIALMLAGASSKNHFYRGHSCLTLAMYSANFKLLKAFLHSKHFHPNDLLGNHLGTALHVLVSTEFQKKTVYDVSIKLCDLLLEAGADPTKEASKSLGNCIDYGYREIEAEKETRRGTTSGKKDTAKSEKGGKEKGGARDHLKDHVRVMEYLKERMKKRKDEEGDSEWKWKWKGKESRAKKSGVQRPSEDSGRVELSKGSGEEGGEKWKAGEESKRRKVGSKEEVRSMGREEENEDRMEGRMEGGMKRRMEGEMKGRMEGEMKGRMEGGMEGEMKGRMEGGMEGEMKGRMEGGMKRRIEGEMKGRTEGRTEDSVKGRVDGRAEWRTEERAKEGKRKKDKEEDEERRGGKKGKKKGEDEEWGTKKSGDKERERGKEKVKDKDKEWKEKSKEQGKEQESRKTESSLLRDKTRGSVKTASQKACSETFPEKVRQDLLKMFGNCVNIDVNELLLPYVVLRDGELYYRFQGRETGHKEQYSLI